MADQLQIRTKRMVLTHWAVPGWAPTCPVSTCVRQSAQAGRVCRPQSLGWSRQCWCCLGEWCCRAPAAGPPGCCTSPAGRTAVVTLAPAITNNVRAKHDSKVYLNKHKSKLYLTSNFFIQLWTHSKILNCDQKKMESLNNKKLPVNVFIYLRPLGPFLQLSIECRK